jgi:DNA-binding response OmpR family regulator
MRVLVVEDNSVVADAVAEGLRDQGMAVDVAYDGPSGLDKAVLNTYDVVVLDREVLLSADGAVVSAEQLLEQVWDEYADPFTKTVTVTIGRLRRKLGQPPLLETVIGGGYRIP